MPLLNSNSEYALIKKIAPGWYLIIFWVLACLVPREAQSQDIVESNFHWAYASFFGTGWYKLNDERRAFILRAAPRWTRGESRIDEQGNREIAYTFRVPVTLGLSQFDFGNIPGIIDSDNLTTASVNFSVDADIPVTQQFSVRPSAEVGYGTILGESSSAWTHKVELRSEYKFQPGKLDWALLGGLGAVGYKPNEGPSDDFSYLLVGAEFSYPVGWPRANNDQVMLYWHFSYTNFLDDIEFQNGVEEQDSVTDYWQIGVALGKRREPIRLWFLKFDRLGLAYNFSTTSQLRGIKFVFRSLYEL